MVYFSGHVEGETLRRAKTTGDRRDGRLEGRETGRKVEPERRETGRKVQPETEGKPEATGGRQTERGSFGIVGRTDG
jgi:hypothetical protein